MAHNRVGLGFCRWKVMKWSVQWSCILQLWWNCWILWLSERPFRILGLKNWIPILKIGELLLDPIVQPCPTIHFHDACDPNRLGMTGCGLPPGTTLATKAGNFLLKGGNWGVDIALCLIRWADGCFKNYQRKAFLQEETCRLLTCAGWTWVQICRFTPGVSEPSGGGLVYMRVPCVKLDGVGLSRGSATTTSTCDRNRSGIGHRPGPGIFQ